LTNQVWGALFFLILRTIASHVRAIPRVIEDALAIVGCMWEPQSFPLWWNRISPSDWSKNWPIRFQESFSFLFFGQPLVMFGPILGLSRALYRLMGLCGIPVVPFVVKQNLAIRLVEKLTNQISRALFCFILRTTASHVRANPRVIEGAQSIDGYM